MTQPSGVVAVVVTWNRRDLLAESLRSVLDQTQPPDHVVVVDNASDDGTADLLSAEFPGVQTIRTTHNIGGAGGFALGIAAALRRPCDALWLLDDDTVPRRSALEALLDVRRRYPAGTPALVASRVVWTDGRDHPMNTARRKPVVRERERAAAEAVGCLPIRSASFVSVLVDAKAAAATGLPVADFFLWNDDFEYTTRLLRGRVGLASRSSVVVHKTATFGATETDPGDRFFYEVRNKVWTFTRSDGLGPGERALYAGSTVRRWARTYAGSPDRAALRRALVAGLRSGLRDKPADTAAVIEQATAGRGLDG